MKSILKGFGLFDNKRFIFVIAGAFFVLTSAVIIPKVNLSEKKAEASSVISFPRDHGQHPKFAAEWWYMNLLVRTAKVDIVDEIKAQNKDLGYVISFSRIFGQNGLLSSEYDQNTKSFREATDTGGKLSVSLKDGKYLRLQYSNGMTRLILEETPPNPDKKRVYRLTGRTPQIGRVNLVLKERTLASTGYNEPLLWGGTTGNCSGKISVFSDNDTFYYSIPDLDVSGTIIGENGVARKIEAGKAWLDHQWFDSGPSANWKGHYWANFHYSHSNDVYTTGPHQAVGFVTQIYNDGARYTYWVKRNADGTNECGTGGKISINGYSPTEYPSSWKIELKKPEGLFLTTTGASFSEDQVFKPSSGPAFFEPASFYTGTVDGKLFTGLGFFETHLKKP